MPIQFLSVVIRHRLSRTLATALMPDPLLRAVPPGMQARTPKTNPLCRRAKSARASELQEAVYTVSGGASSTAFVDRRGGPQARTARCWQVGPRRAELGHALDCRGTRPDSARRTRAGPVAPAGLA